MKESVATSTILKIILAFTLLFSGFLAVAITYNRVYRQKNEVVSIIEKYEGITNKSIKLINNYLKNSGYDTLGYCEEGEYGVSSLDNEDYELALTNKKYYYCLSNYCSTNRCIINDNGAPNGNSIFYKTKLFFKFNLPFLGDLMIFKITGDTKAIKLYAQNQILHDN